MSEHQLSIPLYQNELEQVNEAIQNLPPNMKSQVSDGFHTYGQLYDHRCQLYITLCVALKRATSFPIWRSKTHSNGEVWDGWFLLGISANPGEQITYHLPMKYWEMCNFAAEYNKAPTYDGHSSEDVLTRLVTLAYIIM